MYIFNHALIFCFSSLFLYSIFYLDKGDILGHVDSTINGLTIIRTSGKTKKYKEKFFTEYNNHTAAYFPFVAIKRWFAIRIDLTVVFFVCLVLTSCIFLNGNFYWKFRLS
jgi:hypothetical protein